MVRSSKVGLRMFRVSGFICPDSATHRLVVFVHTIIAAIQAVALLYRAVTSSSKISIRLYPYISIITESTIPCYKMMGDDSGIDGSDMDDSSMDGSGMDDSGMDGSDTDGGSKTDRFARKPVSKQEKSVLDMAGYPEIADHFLSGSVFLNKFSGGPQQGLPIANLSVKALAALGYGPETKILMPPSAVALTVLESRPRRRAVTAETLEWQFGEAAQASTSTWVPYAEEIDHIRMSSVGQPVRERLKKVLHDWHHHAVKKAWDAGCIYGMFMALGTVETGKRLMPIIIGLHRQGLTNYDDYDVSLWPTIDEAIDNSDVVKVEASDEPTAVYMRFKFLDLPVFVGLGGTDHDCIFVPMNTTVTKTRSREFIPDARDYTGGRSIHDGFPLVHIHECVPFCDIYVGAGRHPPPGTDPDPLVEACEYYAQWVRNLIDFFCIPDIHTVRTVISSTIPAASTTSTVTSTADTVTETADTVTETADTVTETADTATDSVFDDTDSQGQQWDEHDTYSLEDDDNG